MEYEKNVCPVLNVDGILATGKQFDLEITLPEDNRTVIYGVVKDCYHEPVSDAVVKLVEVVCECGKEERRPVSHTFTDDEGEFVFGPLCANRFYEIEIWVDRVKHCKICKKVERDVDCLKGIKIECKHKDNDCKPERPYEKEYDEKCEKKCEKKCDKDYDKEYDKKCEKDYDKDYEKKCEKDYDREHDKDCEKKCEKHDEKHDKDCDKHDEKEERPCNRPCRPCFRPY